MAAVSLGRAEIALWSDPGGTAVEIPSLTAASRRLVSAGTVVQFAGDAFPTPFRGEGRSGSYDLACQFDLAKHETAADLVDLLTVVAPAAPDSRLLLRTHVGNVAGLDPVVAVVVFDVGVSPQRGRILVVSFTATVVQASVEV